MPAVAALLVIAADALIIFPAPALGFGVKSNTSCAVQRGRRPSMSSSSRRAMTDTEGDEGDDEYNPRGILGRSIRGFQSSALKTAIEPGDTVVCKCEIPTLNIVENASYEVDSIYAQYFDDETQSIVKQQLSSLDEPIPPNSERYVTLYSPVYHKDGSPVVVTPEEVSLTSVRSELNSAAWLAVPGFFWVFVAASFYNIYHERTGGSFVDAFWGR